MEISLSQSAYSVAVGSYISILPTCEPPPPGGVANSWNNPTLGFYRLRRPKGVLVIPRGLTFNPATGEISGIPLEAMTVETLTLEFILYSSLATVGTKTLSAVGGVTAWPLKGTILMWSISPLSYDGDELSLLSLNGNEYTFSYMGSGEPYHPYGNGEFVAVRAQDVIPDKSNVLEFTLKVTGGGTVDPDPDALAHNFALPFTWNTRTGAVAAEVFLVAATADDDPYEEELPVTLRDPLIVPVKVGDLYRWGFHLIMTGTTPDTVAPAWLQILVWGPESNQPVVVGAAVPTSIYYGEKRYWTLAVDFSREKLESICSRLSDAPAVLLDAEVRAVTAPIGESEVRYTKASRTFRIWLEDSGAVDDSFPTC